MNLELERRKKEIYLVCVHEIGHYVMAKECKFPTKGVKLQFYSPSGHDGSNTINIFNKGLDNIEKIKEFLVKRIKVLYAGVVAESMDIEGNYDPDYANNQWEKEGGRMDHANIRELVRLLRDLKHTETESEEQMNNELKTLDNDIINEVGNLIQSKIKLIHGIASSLHDKVKELNKMYELTEEELNAIPQISILYNEPNNDSESTILE